MEALRGLKSSPDSAYDELVTGQKSIRYHWQGILSVIRALPGGGLAERVESAENVDKHLVDHGETNSNAEPIADPVEVEQKRIAAPVCGKKHGEGDELNDDVSEEELELAVQPAPEHERSDCHLQ